MMILNSTLVLINSVPKIYFLGKFGPEKAKYFVLNETRYTMALILNSTIVFLNSVPKIPF